MNDRDVRRLLFICSRNQWRSPTAENVFRRHPSVEVRSAGTSAKARRTVSVSDLQWADEIIVMESKHKQTLRAKFDRSLLRRDIHVLNIPDEYQFMDPELVQLLLDVVEPILERRD